MGGLRLLALPILQLGTFVSEAWTAARGETPHAEVPPLDASLGAIGEAVLDRSFTLGVNLVTGVPNPGDVRAAREAVDRAANVAQTRGWLHDPRSFFRTPPRVEQWDEKEGRAYAQGRFLGYRELSFESEYRAHPALPHADRWVGYSHNQRAYAYVLEHEGEPERPWVVGVHGFGMGSPLVNFAGFNARRLHCDLGLNVLLPVLPLHGPRGGARFSGSELLTPDFVNLIYVFSQAVWDIRRMLGWLRDRGADRIGLWGVSLGGYTSALVSAFEGDLDCVIAGIPPSDFPNVARDNQPWVMRGYERELELDWHNVRKMTHMVSPLALDPVVPRERRFIYAGIADRVVRPDQARALWRHWGRPEMLWYSGGHVASQWKGEVVGFVERALAKSGVSHAASASA